MEHRGYEKCREKTVSDTLRLYEQKKLKASGDKKVTNRKQAIAIALSNAKYNCKYSKNDYQKIYAKVKEFLYNDDRKISKKKVPLTNVVETIILIKNLLKVIRNRKQKE